MALLGTGTTGSGSPKLAYELYADNVGGSGNSRTIRITVKFKVNGSSSSYYGYPTSWQPRIQTPYEFVFGSWQSIKGSETWNGGQGWRQYSQDITFDSRTTGSIAVVPGFEVKSTSGGEWNGSVSHGNFGTSTTNTAPYFPSGSSVTIRANNSSGSVLSGIIPENIGKFHVSWSGANDNEGGTLRYWLCENYNNSGWNIKYNGGTDRSYTYDTTTGNEGATYQFYVDCRDSSDALSGKIYSTTLTRNRFTQATLNSSSSINYDTSSISFTYSGASNTNGNTSFSYKLSCSEITVYNPTLASSPATVTIYKSGTVPNNCYIKFEDIKNKFKGSSYKGTLNFTLTTTNAYGTSKTSSKSISVDLRTNPNAVSSCSISGDKSLSTCIKTTADTSSNYYIPDGTKVVRVVWSGGSCKLGSSITYDIQAKFGGGSYTNIATGLSSSTTYYNYVVPKQTTSQSLTFRIIVKSSFGYTATKDTSAITLHYYNEPSITIGTITRAETTASVVVTVKTNSSIPNINTSGSWKMSTTNQTGNLTVTQGAQTINTTGLTGGGTYTLSITYNDKTGFASNKTHNVAIGANLPVLDINKYGIGVNGMSANSTTALNVKGAINTSDYSANSNIIAGQNGRGSIRSSDLNTITKSGFYDINTGSNKPGTNDWYWVINNSHTNNGNYGMQIAVANTQSAQHYIRATDGNGAGTWHRIYSTGYKPSLVDLNSQAFNSGNDLNTYNPTKTWVGRTGNNSTNRPSDWRTVFNIGADNNSNGQLSWNYTDGELDLRFRKRHDTSGNYGSWRKIYHDGNWKELALLMYPVGAIYMSTSNTNPSSIFGGTWEAWGSGRVPVGVNTNDGDFNTPNKTGGSKNQTLRATIGAVGNNVGAIGYQAQPGLSNVSYSGGYGVVGNAPSHGANVNHSTEVLQSNSKPPTTVQPYITCYMWRRTA